MDKRRTFSDPNILLIRDSVAELPKWKNV